jgi:hypothetical protein
VDKPVVVQPNGLCWCDCGELAKPGSYFVQGHDKRAERYLTAIEGSHSIAERLAAQGFIPGSGRSLCDETLKADSSYERCGRKNLDGQPCRVIGKGVGIRRHRAADDRHQAD